MTYRIIVSAINGYNCLYFETEVQRCARIPSDGEEAKVKLVSKNIVIVYQAEREEMPAVSGTKYDRNLLQYLPKIRCT